jgi:hypothetical protein
MSYNLRNRVVESVSVTKEIKQVTSVSKKR